MWDYFSGKGLGPIGKSGRENGQIQIFEIHLLVEILWKGVFFQDGNASIHTAKDVNEWVAKKPKFYRI